MRAILMLTALAAGCARAPEPDAYGNVEATEVVVSAEGSGQLISFTVEEGNKLAADATVGEIDRTQLELQRTEASAQRSATAARVAEVQQQMEALVAQREAAVAQRAALVAQGLERARQFSWANTAQQVLSVYEEVAVGTPAARR